MPDSTSLSITGSEKLLSLLVTALANATLHLYKYGSLAPTPTTPEGDFVLAECDFDGYAPITIATYPPPFLLGSGWAIETQQRFNFDSGSPLSGGNQVGGWWLELADTTLIEYGTFENGRPAQADGQAVFVTAVLPIAAQQLL